MTGILCCWRSCNKHYCRSRHCCWPYVCLHTSSAHTPWLDPQRNFLFCPETRSQSSHQPSLAGVSTSQPYRDFHMECAGQQSWLPLIKKTVPIKFGEVSGVLFYWPQWNQNFPWHHCNPKSQENPWGHLVLTLTQVDVA